MEHTNFMPSNFIAVINQASIEQLAAAAQREQSSKLGLQRHEKHLQKRMQQLQQPNNNTKTQKE